jgi:Rps23 Pro-64 3,4-dihydroxylase Tpa1-like proline 4-hydroxylase
MSDSPFANNLVNPAVVEAILSIESYLRPSLREAGSAMADVGARLAAGQLVVIRNRNHSLPHNDAMASGPDAFRQVAFVWHLAKNWRSEWGGTLFWCPRALYLPPVFNTLLLFIVGRDTSHFVTQVSPYAQGKRLAINGWWTGPASSMMSCTRIGMRDARVMERNHTVKLHLSAQSFQSRVIRSIE